MYNEIKYIVVKVLKKIFNFTIMKNSKIDKTSRVCLATQLVDVTIDKYSYIGNNCVVVSVSIGAFCSISNNCLIGAGAHPVDWVSSSPVFYNGKNILNKNFSTHQFSLYKHTNIGNDVWVGTNAIIMGGINIGDGAIIAAGAIVTKDVPPYAVVAGVPAKIIKYRFDEGTIEKLLELKWWNWSDEMLTENANRFSSIDDFLNNIQE